MVVDGDVEELPARARGVIVLAITGDAMARAHDACEFLDVEVDEIARVLALVAAHRRRRLQGGEAGAMAEQEAGDGGFGELGGAGDLEAREFAAVQREDASHPERVGGSGGTFWARTAIGEPAVALGAEAGEPLVSGAHRNAKGGGHIGDGLVEMVDAADHLGSTQGGEFGLTVRVHVALEFGLLVISQPHLSNSSPHEQPIGTSQLG